MQIVSLVQIKLEYMEMARKALENLENETKIREEPGTI